MNLFDKIVDYRYFLNYIIESYNEDIQLRSLNYQWETRVFLKKYQKIVKKKYPNLAKSLDLYNMRDYLNVLDFSKDDHKLLYVYIISRFSYLSIREYLKHRNLDRSLTAILQICNSLKQIELSEKSDPELDVLSNIFNQMFKSGRNNLHCYDCGTTARGIFYSLIKEYRGDFHIREDEIYQIRNEYLSLSHDDGFQGLEQLVGNLKKINQPVVFIVGLKFGDDKFGHIFIMEKQFIEEKPVIRIYQSALNSYLLMDYIVHAGYLESPSKGIDLDDFEKDMLHLLSVPKWGERENLLFVKWYAFYPQSEIDDTSEIRINSSYLIY